MQVSISEMLTFGASGTKQPGYCIGEAWIDSTTASATGKAASMPEV